MPKTQRLGTANIGRLLWELSIPAMVGSAVMALYNVVDRLFIGRGCGTEAMAGLTLTFPYMMVLASFGVLFGVGSGAMISIRLGEGRHDEAEKVLGQGIALKLLFVVFPMLALVFLDKTIALFGGNAASIPYAHDYLRVVLWGNVFSHLGFGMSAFMRAEGNARKSMTAMLIGAGANVVLDPLFIFGFGMGIRGAAWATNIAMFLSACYGFAHFLGPRCHVRLHVRNIRLWASRLGPVLAIGLSPFFLHLIASLAQVSYNHAFRLWAADSHAANVAIAASGTINGILLFVLMPVFGLTQGMQPIVGFNYGARNFERVARAFKLTMIAATVICAAGTVSCMALASPLAAAFTKAPDVHALTRWSLRVACAAFPFIGAPITSTTYFQAIGRAKVAIVLSILRQALLLIPLIFLLPMLFGARAIWFSAPISDLASAAVSMTVVVFELRRLRRLQDAIDQVAGA